MMAVLVGLLATSTAAATAQDREAQWTLGTDRDGHVVASFAAWDHSMTVFTAACDHNSGQLIIRYTLAAAGIPIKGAPTMYLGPIKLQTKRVGGVLEGRAVPDAQLQRLIASPNDIEIAAPNDMSEPWYLGRAEPLRNVAATCPRIAGNR